MKSNKIIGLLLLLFSLVSNKLSAQRVIVIGLDGFGAEGYKTAKHPNIDALIADGVLSLTTRPVMPSVTMPNWTSHLSGAGPEEHGVVNNNWTIDKHELQPIEADQEGFYPSIFKLLKDQVPHVKTGFYYNWANLIKSFNQKYLDEISFEENFEFTNNYQKAFDFIVANKKEPTMVFLYTVHIDHAGHDYKWLSPQYITAIEEADVAIGKLMNQLKADNLYNDTHFILIADHGGIPTGHGGVSMSEMQVPWGATGPQFNHLGLVDFPNSNKNTSLAIANIFGLKEIPDSWTGLLPELILKKKNKRLKKYFR
ncbi:alkaline phosphatase family protein [Emticicia sp. BO119]|uniref:alkaline phosphatase family protein n=1 Tax=Emticicia sp. BO119 TaxID=2757768 RepID=UPI0015F0F6D8|nr:alkaline phosphatase family protein [Emticicia sp. BO119]MBA4849207.1 alkaline phosphatase family protein [Emticicia sp. BO119]